MKNMLGLVFAAMLVGSGEWHRVTLTFYALDANLQRAQVTRCLCRPTT